MAVVEAGTVSRAADVLRISQPAASKLIQDLEADTGLQLFERESGRLVPTGRGMRLYEEVERVFGGVHQIARAVDAIRREEHGHLIIGTMPALSGPFITRAIAAFKARYPDVFISIEARSSQFLTEAVMLRRLDLALVVSGLEHPSVQMERVKCPPYVVAMAHGHRLSEQSELSPVDLRDEPFIAFSPTGMTRSNVDAAFERFGLTPKITIEATTAPNVAEMVAAGLGVTVADPFALEHAAGRIVARPFRPVVEADYVLIRPIRARNSTLIADFVGEIHATARSPMLTVQKSPASTND